MDIWVKSKDEGQDRLFFVQGYSLICDIWIVLLERDYKNGDIGF